MSKYKSTYISGDLTLIHHLSGDVITSDCSGTTIACLRVVRTNSVAVTIVYNASRTRAVKLRNLTKLKRFQLYTATKLIRLILQQYLVAGTVDNVLYSTQQSPLPRHRHSASDSNAAIFELVELLAG